MLGTDERAEGTIRVYFADNTYKTLPVKGDTPVSQVIEHVCNKLSAGGRQLDPENHELFIIAPGHQTLRERRLLHEDRPLQIQKSGSAAFKFLFRETQVSRNGASKSEGGEMHATSDAGSPMEGLDEKKQEEPPQSTRSWPPPVFDMSGSLKKGTLELRATQGDGTTWTWHSCEVILNEDRLWYSQRPDKSMSNNGGGMAYLDLCDCDRVVECEDAKLMQLVTKSGTMILRARSAKERNTWLLAVVKQAALIKERDIIQQAERIITGMELKRSTKQLDRLDAFEKLSGTLAHREARELFLNFARSTFETCSGDAAPGPPAWWPVALPLGRVIACLERRGAAYDAAEGSDELADSADRVDDKPAWELAEGPLFEAFLDHAPSQCWICKFAAGIA